MYLFSLRNPVPASVVDKSELSNTFKKYNLIPPYGTTEESGHAFLDLLKTITALSPTYNAVVGDLQAYAFGLEMDFQPRRVPGLRGQPLEVLDIGAQIEYATYLSTLNISLVDLLKVTRRLFRYLKDNGNGYLHIKRVQMGGTVKYWFKAVHYKHGLYLVSKDPGREFMLLSRKWEDKYMQENPPIFVEVTEVGREIIWTKNT